MSDDLRRLSERACWDPFFLGFVLAAYQRRHGLDDAALARELGAHDTAVVVALRLCRRPGTAEHDAHAQPDRALEGDVEEIARRFAVDRTVLARIVNEAGAWRPYRRPDVSKSPRVAPAARGLLHAPPARLPSRITPSRNPAG